MHMNQLVETRRDIPENPEAVKPIGLVFALGIEAGALFDRMKNTRTTVGNGLTYREGILGSRTIVSVESGIGLDNAQKAADSLIDVFRPCRIISAGFAGALDPEIRRNSIHFPGKVFCRDYSLEIPGGTDAISLLTLDHIVYSIEDKRSLWESTGIQLVDMESFAVAQTANRLHVPFTSVRVVFDTADEELPNEIRKITAQNQSTARMIGTVFGVIFKRPSSVLDMYKLKEKSLVSADALALELEKYVNSLEPKSTL